ncbi:MAG: N-acetylmuramoyl-L-alanine amidase family protein, partial [Actinomycetota bacterium]
MRIRVAAASAILGVGLLTVVGSLGVARGASAQGTITEKEINLDEALRLAQRLRGVGLDPVLTRDRDAFVSLGDRMRIANSAGAELFISVHNNGSVSRAARGTEVYHQRRNARGERLAGDILTRITARTGLPQRGVFTRQSSGGHDSDYYFVLRNSRITAVLVEGAFVTNPTDARLLADPAFRQNLADAMAEAVTATFRPGPQSNGPGPPKARNGPGGVGVETPQDPSSEQPERGRIILTWRASQGATRYQIWRNGGLLADKATEALPLGRQGTLSFEDPKVPQGVHLYQIQALMEVSGMTIASSEPAP